MIPTRFPRFLTILPLGALLLGGCATQNGTSTASDPLRGLAASFLTARAFDRSVLATQRGDMAALKAANEELQRARLVNAPLSERLNSEGYLLAENGNTLAEFERAVTLTQASLAEYDREIKNLAPNDPRLPDLRFGRASGPRDSHAWALFKVGQFEQARQEQELAIREMRESGSKTAISPDIPFHLAEIYRALGASQKSREAYQQALSLSPDADLRARIGAGLEILG